MSWYKPSRHICVEPYGPYADVLESSGFEVVRKSALEALKETKAQAVYLLDVIEHMEKDEAREVIELSMRADQVVIFTPYGFVPQESDAWGMGGEYWQKHRSGWLPEEFPGWETYRRAAIEGFYAVLTK